jgi:CRISPR-associated endonuclease/helicase Cas3
MAAPVAVGTVDQAMLSVLRARHAWLRRALLTRAVLVVDEVHAGDAYMHAITSTLVREHLRDGGHVVLLSATLGESLRADLLVRSPLSIGRAVAAPWPSIWAGSVAYALPSTNVSTRFELVDETALLAEITRASDCGASVLVIRSTVSDAVATWSSLRSVLPGDRLLLHHSRWADVDRRVLDHLVTARLGKAAQRGLGWVVVGTQTVEQSLDIDADLLITDACPADVLLQRRGRLHRHANHRPVGYEAARVLIIRPDVEGVLAPGARLTIPGQNGRQGQGWAFVYSVLSVASTLRVLEELGGDVLLPRDARRLVEAATHPEALAHETSRGDAWAAAWQEQRGAAYARMQLADAGLLTFDAPYDDRQRPTDAVTRLGDGTVTVEVRGLVSPLTNVPLDALPIPARWLRGTEPSLVGESVGATLKVGDVAMSYGEAGLMRG